MRACAGGALLHRWLLICCATACSASVASPAGEQSFAFVSVRDGGPQVYVRDGAGERAVTRGAAASQPVWAPDGKRLALLRYEGGGTRMYVHDLASGLGKPVGAGDAIESAAAFAPDGRALAHFALDRDGAKASLRIADLTGGGGSVVVAIPGKAVSSTAPEWSADGRTLAFVAANAEQRMQVFVVARDGSGLKAVSDPRRQVAQAALSPDGRFVAYLMNLREQGVDVVVTDLVTLDTRSLVSLPGARHERPRWSPDGRQLAFASDRDDPMRTRTDVFVVEADGTRMRNLTRHPAEDFDPQWSADGRTILFTSLRSGHSQIYAVDVASGETARLTQAATQDFEQAPRPPHR